MENNLKERIVELSSNFELVDFIDFLVSHGYSPSADKYYYEVEKFLKKSKHKVDDYVKMALDIYENDLLSISEIPELEGLSNDELSILHCWAIARNYQKKIMEDEEYSDEEKDTTNNKKGDIEQTVFKDELLDCVFAKYNERRQSNVMKY